MPKRHRSFGGILLLKKPKNKSLFGTYALFFFLVQFIPLFIISIFFISSLNNVLREKKLDEKKIQMNLMADNLNKQVENLVLCARRLSISNNIYQYRLSNPTVYGPAIINDLRTNVFSSQITSDIYIFSHNAPYAYSSYSTYSIDRFIFRVTEGAMNEDQYAEFLASLGSDTPKIVYNSNTVLLYFHFPVSDLHSDTFVIFEISKTLLREYIRSVSIPGQFMFAIYGQDSDSQHYNLYQNDDFSETYEILADMMQNSGNNTSVMRKQADRSLFISKAPITDWNYCYVVPEDDIVSLVSDFQVRTYTFLFIAVLLGNILVLLFTYGSYKPIKDLKLYLERLANVDALDKGTSANELHAIEQMARNLHTSVQELSNLNRMSRVALKQFIIMRLVQGAVDDYDAIRNDLAQIGLFIENEYLFVGTMNLSDDAPNISEYIEFIDNFAEGNDVSVYAVLGYEKQQIVLLFSASQDDSESYLPFLERLHDEFSAKFPIGATICIGMAYPELKHLSTSYTQAKMAYEYRSICSNDKILLYAPSSYNFVVDFKYQNMLDFFEKAIINCKPQDVKEPLEYISKFVLQENTTIYSTRYICQNLLMLATSVAYTLPYLPASGFSAGEHLSRIMDMKTLEDFTGFLDDFGTYVLSFLDEYLKFSSQNDVGSDKQDLVESLIDFIDSKLVSNQLSVVSIATHFGFSTSYISRIFKECKNMTILEYINNKRISLACSLLTTTDKNVDTIVGEVGYFDTSSFIRKFKKNMGVTPGDYRKSMVGK